MVFRQRKFFLAPAARLEKMPDEALVQDFSQTGNREAMAELFRRYTHLVFGVCMKYLEDEEESRDAVMQIFESLFDNLSRQKIDNFRGWLYTVSRNHCLMLIRKKKKMPLSQEQLAEKIPVDDVEYESDLHLFSDPGSEKSAGLLREALESLHPGQKRCIELMYLESKTYKEIAEITGFSMNQVKSHIQNGKRNLKLKLEGYEE